MTFHSPRLTGVALAAGLALAGCGGNDAPVENQIPAGLTQHSVTAYIATAVGSGTTAATQDLLTAGLGKTGLGSPTAPTYADPLNPTALELRRAAIYSNYRAILDFTANGGYGSLYGPNIDLAGGNTLGEGLVPGKEYLASIDDGSGRKRVAVAVQIPSNFNPDKACIVAGPSSGSRGVYGAIGSSAEWGLKRGCAVVLTDAGKGMGLYDPSDDTVNQVDGTRATRTVAGALSHFAAAIPDAARAIFNAAFPNRLSLKHVHSQLNPEKDWGQDTLNAIRYAFYALNQEYGQDIGGGVKEARLNPGNAIVIAGSVSNGGAAVLQAAEQDTDGLIDGVVAGEPSAQPKGTSGFGVTLGGTPVPTIGKSLADYVTFANLYQPCAALAPEATIPDTGGFFNYMGAIAMNGRAANRCAALAAKGLVTGASTDAQASDALAKLRAYGWNADPDPAKQDMMHNAHYGLGNQAILSMMYPNAYGRFSLTDNLCNMSLAQTSATGDIVPVTAATKAQSFAGGNGTANGVPASVVINNSVGGAKNWAFAVSPSSGTQDLALDAGLCARSLVIGKDAVTGADLTTTSTPTLAQSQAVRTGVSEVLLGGNLRGKPTLIVQGRHDALVPVNHNSRAYVSFNRSVEGSGSQVSYVEVANAQHFDTFVSLAGWDTRFVPLHPYFVSAMNAMYAKLTAGTALPPSQVVRGVPRGGTPGAAPAITATNVPPIATAPAAANAISFTNTTLNVPN